MSLHSTAHYSHMPPPVSAFILPGKHHPTTSTSSILLSVKSSQDSPQNPSTSLRRPTTQNPFRTSISQTSQVSKNPLKNLINSQNTPTIPPSDSLSNKLWLSSKLSPPPPPPTPPRLLNETVESGKGDGTLESTENCGEEDDERGMEFREKGKIFVGNLPLWIKKNEVAEFFRQFGPIKNVILIKGHDDIERNVGFGFVIYSGPTAEKAAMKAVEFDGVEFHGRVLSVKLDNGRRMKAKTEGRARWIEGREGDGDEYRSKWHEEREGSRREFRKVLETHPENWQAVVRMFERIKKVLL